MTSYGEYSPEEEVRAEYDAAKRKVLEGKAPRLLSRVTVVFLWAIRERTIRRLRKTGRAGPAG